MNEMFKINDVSGQCGETVEHAGQFLPYAHRKLGFNKPVGVNFVSDPENAKNPLGKTGYYDPNKMEITIFVDKRHVKDILRSLSHELVHHTQNCRGEFDKGLDTGPGYAQKDPHMRKMEAEAYLLGNGFLFRDWEDHLKLKESKTMAKKKIKEGHDCAVHKDETHAQWEAKEAKKQAEVVEGLKETQKMSDNLNEAQSSPAWKFKLVKTWRTGLTKTIYITQACMGQPCAKHVALRIAKTTLHFQNAVKRGYEIVGAEAVGLDDPDRGHGALQEDVIEEEEDLVTKVGKAAERAGEVVKKSAAKKAAAAAAKKKAAAEKNENWVRGNKDELLFERLVKRWAK